MTAKRILDATAATVGLIALGPIMVVIAIAIRATSSGPAIFQQTRLGKGEVPFTLYKFRTMGQGTGDLPTHQVDAAQVTKIGHFLRRTKLDELPQLLNVLRGDMSLVGPRPGLPGQHALTIARSTRGVFDIRPGITGPSQVAGIDMSEPERLAESDATYLASHSLASDLRFIVRTVTGSGSGDRIPPSDG